MSGDKAERTTYEATLPDGRRVSRRSSNRLRALVAYRDGETWHEGRWSKTRSLADDRRRWLLASRMADEAVVIYCSPVAPEEGA